MSKLNCVTQKLLLFTGGVRAVGSRFLHNFYLLDPCPLQFSLMLCEDNVSNGNVFYSFQLAIVTNVYEMISGQVDRIPGFRTDLIVQFHSRSISMAYKMIQKNYLETIFV